MKSGEKLEWVELDQKILDKVFVNANSPDKTSHLTIAATIYRSRSIDFGHIDFVFLTSVLFRFDNDHSAHCKTPAEPGVTDKSLRGLINWQGMEGKVD